MDPLDKTMSAISQRERMLAGELYSPLDPELVRRQARARELAAKESLKLTVSGPFPPFSFAELATETPTAAAKAQ